MKQINLIILLIAVFFSGCKKNENNLTPDSKNALLANLKNSGDQIVKGKKIDGATNSVNNTLNPYNKVGQLHNNLLDGFKKEIPSLYSPTTAVSYTINGKQYSYTKVKDKLIAGSYVNYQKTNEPQTLPNSTSNLSYDGYADYQSLVNQTMDYLVANPIPDLGPVDPVIFENNFNTQLQQFQTSNGLTEIENQIDNQLINQLLACEDISTATSLVNFYQNTIVSDGSITDQTVLDRQLSFLSVLNYSMNYWYAVENNPSDPWWNVYGNLFQEDMSQQAKLRWWKWLLIGVSDGLGGLTGLLFANPVAAAFVGGAVGSVASGLVQDWLQQ